MRCRGRCPVLTPKLLEGRVIGLAGGVPEVVGWALATLGARIEPVPLDELLGRGRKPGRRLGSRDALRLPRSSSMRSYVP